ncbi:hypothetical protein [Mucisphaera calidilacus]|uniref:Uncharacterized protein n=1 Tax=Mucisphaera calidilacus TaxID=2527982 RepID=A0A518C0R9_9BACT|nr:hypothetical protein [Mucisphaera calidilacus]QDU72808.1 hypothetical protein Pan265_26820 [Mucisphaera calidilacus]
MPEVGAVPAGLLMTAVMEGSDEHAEAVRIGWAEPLAAGRAVVVWVDGEVAAWTGHEGDRWLWVLMDRRMAHRVAVRELGLEALLGGGVVAAEADGLRVVRDTSWPVDAGLRVSGDGGALACAVWPADVAREGFGSRFGVGPFGVEGEGGPGLGGGILGDGGLGSGGTAVVVDGSVRRRLGGRVCVSVVGEGGGVVSEACVEAVPLGDGVSVGGAVVEGGVMRVRDREVLR